MIKLIIFDLWSTLAYKKYRKGNLRSLMKEVNLKCDYRTLVKTYEKHLQKKKISLEKGLKNLLDELKVSYDGNLIKKYVSSKKRIDNSIAFYKYSVKTLKSLKQKGYKTAILSNSRYSQGEAMKRSILKKYIDNFFFSYELHSIKPDLKNFKYVLSYFKVKPQEALMIGNSYKDDFLPAKKLGIKAIHFKGAKKLKRDLRKMEVII